MLNLNKNQKYLLACSHGPDSMALFYMLKEEGYNFAVAHVNYHLREESNLEQQQLEDYCAKETSNYLLKMLMNIWGTIT
jgi:tRNA(Ile)-lysidine synthase